MEIVLFNNVLCSAFASRLNILFIFDRFKNVSAKTTLLVVQKSKANEKARGRRST